MAERLFDYFTHEDAEALTSDDSGRVRGSTVKISRLVKSIAAGGEGKVYSVNVKQGGKARTFAVKDFSHEGHARIAFERYQMLKKYRISHILPTYRIVEGKNRILMTHLNIDGKVAISVFANHHQRAPRHDIKLESIDEEVVSNILNSFEEDLMIAFKNNIEILMDAYMCTLPKKLRGKLEFDDEKGIPLEIYIADMGSIIEENQNGSRENPHTFGMFLINIFRNFLPPKELEKINNIIDVWVAKMSEKFDSISPNEK